MIGELAQQQGELEIRRVRARASIGQLTGRVASELLRKCVVKQAKPHNPHTRKEAHLSEKRAERIAQMEYFKCKIELSVTPQDLMRALLSHPYHEQFEPALAILAKLKTLSGLLVSYPVEADRRARKLQADIDKLREVLEDIET